ncbi:SPOR domain-containing protein [Saezia sanguinis]|uniref:SPOR domain-containing protein n=1 Tax=Saezia sanguinis TaxID=1965230 RepID=UPI0030DA3D22
MLKQPPSAQTIEQIRIRARRRVIGAIILVVLAVAILPWIFNSQPRPTVVDVPIEVAGQSVLEGEQVSSASPQMVSPPVMQPLDGGVVDSASAPVAITAPETVAPVTSGSIMADPTQPMDSAASTDQHQEAQGGTDLTLSDGYATRPANRPTLSSKVPADAVVASASQSGSTAAPSADAARAANILGDPAIAVTGRTPSAPATSSSTSSASSASTTLKPNDLSRSFVVQVGAYADEAKVSEVRARLTMAGYTSFAQEVQTDAGKRIRVRVGPFNGRAAADAVAEKIRAMGLPAAVLSM